MEENAISQFSKKARNVLLAKVILIVIAGTLCGYLAAKFSAMSDNPGSNTGQVQRIIERIEGAQAEQPVDSVDPLVLVFTIIIMNALFLFFFAVYELLGHGLGALITRISKKT